MADKDAVLAANSSELFSVLEKRLSNAIGKLNDLNFVYDIIASEGYTFSEGRTLIFDFWLLDNRKADDFYNKVVYGVADENRLWYEDLDENERENIDESGVMQFTDECYIEKVDDLIKLTENMEKYLSNQQN